MTGLRLIIVGALVAGFAGCRCQEPSGQDGGSAGGTAGGSSSAGGVSGGGSTAGGSTSGGSTAGGSTAACTVPSGSGAIALDQLCPVLAQGAANFQKRALSTCGEPIEDRDVPHLSGVTLGECADGGLAAFVARLSAKVDAGLQGYDPLKAWQCQGMGRAAGANANQCSGGPCEEIFTGRVALNGACEDSEDCQGSTFCQPAGENSCAGRCVARLRPGAACDPDRDLCERGSPCRAGDGGFQCFVRVAVGGVCSETKDCQDGLGCAGGRCAIRRAAGEPCADTLKHADCLTSLGCVERAGVRTCERRAQLGETCATDGRGAAPCPDSECVECANGRCVAKGVQASACQSQNDCRQSYFCGDAGVCVFRARRGEPCQPSATNTQGSCLYPTDFCRAVVASSAGVCTERPALGAPCGVTPGLTVACAGNDTYCRTTNDAGVCSANPVANEACGRPGLSSTCTDGVCDRDAGVCLGRQPVGAPCASRSPNCAAGTYCPSAPLPQVCTAKKPSGQACSEDEQCAEGLCDRVTRRCSMVCSATYDNEGASCRAGCPNGLRDAWALVLLSMVMGPMSRRRRK